MHHRHFLHSLSNTLWPNDCCVGTLILKLNVFLIELLLWASKTSCTGIYEFFDLLNLIFVNDAQYKWQFFMKLWWGFVFTSLHFDTVRLFSVGITEVYTSIILCLVTSMFPICNFAFSLQQEIFVVLWNNCGQILTQIFRSMSIVLFYALMFSNQLYILFDVL